MVATSLMRADLMLFERTFRVMFLCTSDLRLGGRNPSLQLAAPAVRDGHVASETRESALAPGARALWRTVSDETRVARLGLLLQKDEVVREVGLDHVERLRTDEELTTRGARKGRSERTTSRVARARLPRTCIEPSDQRMSLAFVSRASAPLAAVGPIFQLLSVRLQCAEYQ